MIHSIRHKILKRLHEDDDPRGVIAEHAEKPRDILVRLDAASTVADMDLPGFRLHPLYARLDKTTKDGKEMSAATITQRTFPLAIVGYTQIPISVREQSHQYPHV